MCYCDGQVVCGKQKREAAMSQPPEFPCRFHEQSHQHSAKGWCYGRGIVDGRPFALLEYDGNGEVRAQMLDGPYSITLERKPR